METELASVTPDTWQGVCCFLWVLNLVSQTKGKTHSEGI
jgi:hypothetical protein